MISKDDRATFSAQLQRRRRGRPRAAGPTVRTSVELPEPVFDALCRQAIDQRISLHALVKQALESRARGDFR